MIMALDLVTGYKGTPHITAEDVGAFNSGIFGSGEYVLNTGNKFAASLTSNNTIKILDGDLVMQGRHVSLKKGTFEEVTINNGETGKYRRDLVVVRYTKDNETGVENVEFAVIQGTATTSKSKAKYPECTTGDLYSGDCTLHEMPLIGVLMDGLTAGTPEPVFKVASHFEALSGVSSEMINLTEEEDTPSYWAEKGTGVYGVSMLQGYSGNGTLVNIAYREPGFDSAFQFILNNANDILVRSSVGSGWFYDSGWNHICMNDPVVTGTYSGDEDGDGQFIELSFTPKAVLVFRSDGSATRSRPDGVQGSYIYGGLALKGRPCAVWSDGEDIPAIEIVDGGFRVHSGIVVGDNKKDEVTICTNDPNTFYYVAFR